ncbi:TPA: YutD family protein [Streptococcus suis]
MKKEISPELYNYNKFPGPSFARIGNKVVAENIELDLVENYKEAFDQTIFGQRFSRIMLKFDYIVGDWSNEQLRLKGFYEDKKAVRSDLKISRLDDYLTEFCSFGCAYFVLENPNPQEMPEEPENRQPRRRRNRNRNRSQEQKATIKNQSSKEKNKKQSQKVGRFTIKQDKADKSLAESRDKGKKQFNSKNKKEQQITETKRSFVIRQK